MKRIHSTILIALAAGAALFQSACSDNNNEQLWDQYAEWRNANISWIEAQAKRTNADGTPYYTKVVAPWDVSAYVLMHTIDGPHTDNLVPLSTSTTDVRYHLHLYDGTPVDSSTNIKTYGDGIFRSRLNDDGLIAGWKLAVQNMHADDSVEVLIPYAQAYGTQSLGVIKPYSALRFNLRLVDIPFYELPNYGN